MTKSNIFIESIYPEFEVETRKVFVGTKKILKYFLENDEILEKSCLNNEVFKTLSFDIVFCNDEKIHEINREYRKKDRPTDVITFALFADSAPEERFVFDGEINLGEVIISLDTTLQQSKEKNHSFGEELFFLISHGIMHLLGYDHQTETELQFMLNQQGKSMEKVNVKIHSQQLF